MNSYKLKFDFFFCESFNFYELQELQECLSQK